MFHTYHVLSAEEIETTAIELLEMTAEQTENRLAMLEVIYGATQVGKIQKRFFKKTREAGNG